MVQISIFFFRYEILPDVIVNMISCSVVDHEFDLQRCQIKHTINLYIVVYGTDFYIFVDMKSSQT